jgi:hypothetical protein
MQEKQTTIHQRRRWNRQRASVLGCNSDNEPEEDSKLQWWKEGFSGKKG